MIGIWNAYTNIYLVVVGAVSLLFFGIPLTLVPMSWARVFRWELPQSQNLTITLGRSLGVVISILAIFAFYVIRAPVAKPFYFDMLLWTFVGMLLIHIYGAIRRIQPITETVEIILWVLLGVLTVCFYPV